MRKLILLAMAVMPATAFASDIPTTIYVQNTNVISDDCLSKDKKQDLCQFAKGIQETLAPNLPRALSSKLTINAVAAIGKRLITYAVWPQTKAQMDAYVKSLGVSQSQYDQGLLQVTKRMVCDPKGMLEFIQQGGEIEYQYRTADAFLDKSALVTECP